MLNHVNIDNKLTTCTINNALIVVVCSVARSTSIFGVSHCNMPLIFLSRYLSIRQGSGIGVCILSSGVNMGLPHLSARRYLLATARQYCQKHYIKKGPKSLYFLSPPPRNDVGVRQVWFFIWGTFQSSANYVSHQTKHSKKKKKIL